MFWSLSAFICSWRKERGHHCVQATTSWQTTICHKTWSRALAIPLHVRLFPNPRRRSSSNLLDCESWRSRKRLQTSDFLRNCETAGWPFRRASMKRLCLVTLFRNAWMEQAGLPAFRNNSLFPEESALLVIFAQICLGAKMQAQGMCHRVHFGP